MGDQGRLRPLEAGVKVGQPQGIRAPQMQTSQAFRVYHLSGLETALALES